MLADNPGSNFKDGITADREQRLRSVAAMRQTDVVLVLENVHDPHNIGAVLRTCDSVGIAEVFIVYTEEQLTEETLEKGLNSKTSSGARKWIKTSLFNSVSDCIKELKKRNLKVYGTHLGEEAQSIYNCDFTTPVAVVLGNEHDGLSQEFLNELDGNIYIPRVGMVQSLNISVASAIIVYEIFRQRQLKLLYSANRSNEELFSYYKSVNKDRG